MPISVRCPKCGHGYQLRDELAGKQAKCRCGQTLSIPVATPLTSLLDEEHIGDAPDGMAEAMPPGPVASRPQRGQSSPKFGAGFSKKKKHGKDNTTVIIASVAGGVAVLFVVLLAFFLLSGSEDKPAARVPPPPTAAPPAVASLPGQATPQETFETFKQAQVAKDWPKVYTLLTPEAQNQMTAVLGMVGAMFGPMNPDLSAVMKKHGIDSASFSAPSLGGADSFSETKTATPDLENVFSQAMGATASIKDKQGFFVDALPAFLNFVQSAQFTAIAKMGSQMTGVSISEAFDKLPLFSAASTLADVRINGQKASGIAKTPAAAAPGTPQDADAKEKVTPLKFDQRSGSWYIGAGM